MAATIDDALDFIPLFPDETEDAILTRMRAWANEGLDPALNADQWTDTREGSQWFIGVRPSVIELAKAYDLVGTEVVAAGMAVWAWGPYLDDHAEIQQLVRLAATPAEGSVTFSGPNGTFIDVGTTMSTEPATPDADVPEFETTASGTISAGTLVLPIVATEGGVAGDVSANAITVPSTPVPAGVTFTNPAATDGGTDVETDEALRLRVVQAYQGKGAGTQRDYVRWAGDWSGVGRVTVIPLWDGPGTVKVIVTDANGQPVSAGVVNGLQADLDPTAVTGQGDGRAPIGATVTVATAVAFAITVAGTVFTEDGYTLDGSGGTVAIRAAIIAALKRYIEAVQPGDEIVFEKVRGIMVTVLGAHDVSGVLLNGATANVAVATSPAQAPQLTTTTGIVQG